MQAGLDVPVFRAILRAIATGRQSAGARTRFLSMFNLQDEAKKLAVIQILFAVCIACFVLIAPTGIWGSGIALPRGSADSAPAS